MSIERAGGWLGLVLLAALLACKGGGGDDKKQEGDDDKPATAADEGSKDTPKKRADDGSSAPVETAAPAPAKPTLATLFDGAPGGEVKFIRLVPLRYQGIHIRAPIGWKGYQEYYDGLVQLGPRDNSAVVMVNCGDHGGFKQPQIKLWTKSTGGRGVKYGPVETGKIGKNHNEAQIAKGAGKLGGKEAEFWYALLKLKRGAEVLIVAGIQTGASEKRRQELIACVQSFYQV